MTKTARYAQLVQQRKRCTACDQLANAAEIDGAPVAATFRSDASRHKLSRPTRR